MTKFERDKVYKTRDGKSVRVLCVDAPGPLPMIGIYLDEGETLGGCAPRHTDGRLYTHRDSELDLIPAKPEPVVEWGYVADGHFKKCLDQWAARTEAGVVGLGCERRLAKRTTEVVEP